MPGTCSKLDVGDERYWSLYSQSGSGTGSRRWKSALNIDYYLELRRVHQDH